MSQGNSLKKSEKEAIQDELASEFQPRHKYQTIQSFRPEEVKELLAQHFMKLNHDQVQQQTATRQSGSMSSEEGRRKFFLMRGGRRSGPVSGELVDGDMLVDEQGNGLRAFAALKQDTIHARTSLKVDDDQMSNSSDTSASSSSKDLSKRLSRKDTYFLSNHATSAEKDKLIADLRDQLSRERRIYAEELNRMRAKQKKLKAKMSAQQEKLDQQLMMLENRERAVQAKLISAIEHEGR
jgi:hypothetical protein